MPSIAACCQVATGRQSSPPTISGARQLKDRIVDTSPLIRSPRRKRLNHLATPDRGSTRFNAVSARLGQPVRPAIGAVRLLPEADEPPGRVGHRDFARLPRIMSTAAVGASTKDRPPVFALRASPAIADADGARRSRRQGVICDANSRFLPGLPSNISTTMQEDA